MRILLTLLAIASLLTGCASGGYYAGGYGNGGSFYVQQQQDLARLMNGQQVLVQQQNAGMLLAGQGVGYVNQPRYNGNGLPLTMTGVPQIPAADMLSGNMFSNMYYQNQANQVRQQYDLTAYELMLKQRNEQIRCPPPTQQAVSSRLNTLMSLDRTWTYTGNYSYMVPAATFLADNCKGY